MTLADGLALANALCLAAVLACVVWFDLRYMRIPNVLSLVLIIAFCLTFALGAVVPDIWWRLAIAAFVFAIGFVGFALRLFGGGDVKILTALALYVPIEHLSLTLFGFSVALFTGTLLILVVRRAWRGHRDGWAFLNSKKIPMGFSIGLAGLLTPLAILSMA